MHAYSRRAVIQARLQARMEIARLLFEDWRALVPMLDRGVFFEQAKSVRGLRNALKLLKRQDAELHRCFARQVASQRLRRCGEPLQGEVDAALEWLVSTLPFPLVAPSSVLAHQGWLGFLRDEETELEPETTQLLDLILDEARLARLNDEEGETEDDGLDGRRAVRLSAEMSGASSRFATLGVDPGLATFAENGPNDGGFGSRSYQRWRMRARRRRPRVIESPTEAGRLLCEVTGRELDKLRGLEVRGRPTVAGKRARRELTAAIHDLRSAGKVSVSALASALKCDRATVWRLAKKGQQVNATSSAHIDEGDDSAIAA
jgi:hypothetical protein